MSFNKRLESPVLNFKGPSAAKENLCFLELSNLNKTGKFRRRKHQPTTPLKIAKIILIRPKINHFRKIFLFVKKNGVKNKPTRYSASHINTRGCSSVVERHVANVKVVSSNLITRYSSKLRP